VEVEMFGSLKTSKIHAKLAHLEGSVKAEEIVAEQVYIGRRSKVIGTIIGREVKVDKEAEVEVIIGDEVKIGKKAEAELIEGRIVRIERDAEIGEVRYIEEAEIDEQAEVGKLIKIEQLSREIP